MSWRIGVDIGGTFIDFCALETQTNRVETIKVLTTPDEQVICEGRLDAAALRQHLGSA